jgi:trk system potassium uptake protein TrkA
MKIILTGGHQAAYFLISSLKAGGHDITVINADSEWCAALANAHEVVCINGDETDPRILEEAGTSKADAVIALGDKDSTNLLVCEISKKHFHVKRTLAVVNDPKKREAFIKLGIDKCVSVSQMLIEAIGQETLIEGIIKCLPSETSSIGVYEIILDDRSPATGKKLWEIGLPQDSMVSCIIRMEQTIIPKGMQDLKQVTG